MVAVRSKTSKKFLAILNKYFHSKILFITDYRVCSEKTPQKSLFKIPPEKFLILFSEQTLFQRLLHSALKFEK